MTAATTVSVTTRTFQMADRGPDSVLPSVQPLLEPPYVVGQGIPDEIAEGSRWGKASNVYPYPMQESYTRELAPVELTVAVLENSRIRATFLPGLGGRLWSLHDKASGKELLHGGERVQFANLALRNAWFAGGIEFNIGTRGHSPTTCAPLHTALITTADGQQVLRMWEFDRLREVVFQIDAWLPQDSPVVFVAVRIRNPNADTVPMYWWTNAAVPQTAQTRVLAPAKAAYITDYDGSMTRADPTDFHGVDATWPARNPQAADFFFDLKPEERRWEVALDVDGDGLALVSSARLRGRKLFVWGESTGGRHWQDWLTPGSGGSSATGHPSCRYAEIQSGLAQTQFEHVPMPADATWHWVEAYGNASLDAVVAGDDWDTAVRHAAERVEGLVSEVAIAEALAAAERWADLAPSHIVAPGSGWGALERQRRQLAGAGWIDETGTPFATSTIGPEQRPWVKFLEAATEGSPQFNGAATFVRGQDWADLLDRCSSAEALFHRATLAHADLNPASSADFRQDLETVATLYRAALAQAELSPQSQSLAQRGLGLTLLRLDSVDGDPAESHPADGLSALEKACILAPTNRALLIEAMTRSIEHGSPGVALTLVEAAPTTLRSFGRVRFLTAQALAATGDTAEAAEILRAGLQVADIREGENSISALWQQVCPGEALPEAYQFSMHEPDSGTTA